MPPPPAQMTITPRSSSVRITSIPKIRWGAGEGTARRMLSLSAMNDQPFSRSSRAASAVS